MPMLRLIKILILTCLISAIPSSMYAGSFTFLPADTDVMDLDHNYYYGWQISSTALKNDLQSGNTILAAKLTFKNIWDWVREDTDQLAVYLMAALPSMPSGGNYVATGLWEKWDGQNKLSLPIPANTVYTTVGVWTDPQGGSARNFDLVFDFASLGLLGTLQNYALDGRLGFIFDPDCHYYNDGIKLTIATGRANVPEPSALLLLGLGLAGVGMIVRRK